MTEIKAIKKEREASEDPNNKEEENNTNEESEETQEETSEEEGLENLLQDNTPRRFQPEEQLNTEHLILHSNEEQEKIEHLEDQLKEAPSIKSKDEDKPYKQETKYQSKNNETVYEQRTNSQEEFQPMKDITLVSTEIQMPTTRIQNTQRPMIPINPDMQTHSSEGVSYDPNIKRAKSADELDLPFERETKKYKPI